MGNLEYRIYQFPGGLKLARDGRWIQGGSPVTHERTRSYLNRSLTWSAQAASWGIASGEWFVPVEVEDAPFFVVSIELETDPPLLELSNEQTQPFYPERLTFGPDDVPYVDVSNASAPEGIAAARFTRPAMQSLIARIELRDGKYGVLVGSGGNQKFAAINKRG